MLTDKELVARLVTLAQSERAVLGEVLRLLKKVEIRRLHTTLAFPSLYEFSQKELGYSEWEAHVRIQAVRLIQHVPEVELHLEDGRISLSVVAQAQTCFRREEKKKSPVSLERKREIINSLCGRSKREAEKKLAELFPGAPPQERVQMLADGKVRVEFVLDQETWNQYQELFSIRSHTNPAKRWDVLLTDMLKLAWKKWHPAPEAKKSVWPANEQTRH